MKLDHVTLRTANLSATRQFFLKVFDHLVEKPRPTAIEHIPGHWLYVKDEPILHLIGCCSQGLDQAAEAWDHVGFRMTGYNAFRTKLDNLQIPYSPMELPELRERRIFIRTPFGPIIETVFREVLD